MIMLVCVNTMYVLLYFNAIELTIDTFQRYTYVCNCSRKLPTDTLPCILHYVKQTCYLKMCMNCIASGKYLVMSQVESLDTQ